ncbi:erythroid membrane-associated protein-like isoform X2 [Hemiscyllium ocellatum]|uniref:erythroid membrane-associated protein-like isoform X2 n=1 Tax=Hemiscyllium ocellatum TaxID=170820 RepID=UPI0029661E0A|nr:erythroid membrane-associated protein-like isoform X2 [Hemiscyllium ocellatum]
MSAVGWSVPPSGGLYPSGMLNWSGSTWETLAVTLIAVSTTSWVVYRKRRWDSLGRDHWRTLLGELLLQALLLLGCVFVSYLSDSQRGGFTVKGPDYPTVAHLGADVVLNCSVVFHREESKLQVEWSRPESGAQVLVCDDILEGPCRDFGGGAQHFEGELASGNVSIRLQEVKVSDAGKYQCTVTSSSHSSHTSLELSIVAVGTKPSLSIRQLSTNSLEYTCQSEGWFPEPDVVWKDSDGRNLLPQSTLARGRGKQQLYDVKVHYRATGDLPSAVTCIIHNSLNNVKEVATGRVNDFLPRAQFRVSETEWSRIQSYTVSLTLDPDTANPWLVLMESGTSVQDGEARQAGVRDNPERFQISHCVLASRGFSSGQHYWEVEVGRKEAWDLGLATQSVNRKAKVRGVPNAGHWSLSRLGRTEYQAVDWSPQPQPVELGPELTVVGVYLRYSQGRLSFFDAERRLHLHTFVANFSERVYPFFCPGPYDWQTNAEPLRLPYPAPREQPGEESGHVPVREVDFEGGAPMEPQAS